MRRNGWQLPYHPLQVVAIAVFLALGFAFYVFFAPFVGKKLFQYVIIGLYTPLVTCVFCLYVWCAATDPGDAGMFKSKKYLNMEDNGKQIHPKISGQGAELISSINEAHAATATGVKPLDKDTHADDSGGKLSDRPETKKPSCFSMHFTMVLFSWCHLSFVCNQCHSCDRSSEQQTSEDGMFYCTLCEVEVFRHSKHCRVCDKCVDDFDHHCRWLNNCIGRRNYQMFFILMVSALVLLILQWSIGVLVLILCFIERKQFSVEIASKLGSSFSLVPYIVVVGFCTFLAMVATLPLAQLFFFHVLLIKKGISTYDYIIALREQEQQGVDGQQSPQMSPGSSLTGLSSASSFSAFRGGAWCTPPRLFVEDQFDVVPPEIGMSTSSARMRMATEESTRKRNAATVKISPWILARLNAEEVSKAAAQARKKSKILQPVGRQGVPPGQEKDNSFGSGGSERMIMRTDNRRRANKRGRMPIDIPLKPLAKVTASATESNCSDLAPETSSSLAPLRLEARNAFQTSQDMLSNRMVASSPDSSLGSPNLHPFHASSSGAEDAQGPKSFSTCAVVQEGIQISISSDGYEASGGEDSDRFPSGIVHRSVSNLVFNSGQGDIVDELEVLSLAGLQSDKQPFDQI